MVVLIVCGAGLSAPSGISTFEELRKMGIDTVTKEWTEETINFYEKIYQKTKSAPINNAHKILAKFTDAKIYTMNIDDLLEKAGCRNVIHLHGKIWEFKCVKCNEIRVCSCGGDLVRNIVLYGERTNYSDVINDLFDLEKDDTFIWIGASGRTANFANIANTLDCKKLYFDKSDSCYINNSNFTKFYGNCEETLLELQKFNQ